MFRYAFFSRFYLHANSLIIGQLQAVRDCSGMRFVKTDFLKKNRASKYTKQKLRFTEVEPLFIQNEASLFYESNYSLYLRREDKTGTLYETDYFIYIDSFLLAIPALRTDESK